MQVFRRSLLLFIVLIATTMAAADAQSLLHLQPADSSGSQEKLSVAVRSVDGRYSFEKLGQIGPWTGHTLEDPTWSLNQAAWANTFFWGVGQDRVYVSLDGAIWSSVLQDPSLWLVDIDFADEVAIAVGSRLGIILPAAIPIDFGNGTVLTGVRNAFGNWLAVGGFYDGSRWEDRIYVSTDQGATWNQRTTNSESYLFDIEGAVQQGFPTYVAVGRSGRLLTSTDGSSWSPKNSGTGLNLLGVAYGDGVWVAVGSSGTVVRSTSGGSSWSNVSIGGGTLSSILYTDGQFVAVGQGGRIVRSTNGLDWTHETSGTTEFLEGISHGNGRWVAMGPAGRVWTTTPVFGFTQVGDGPGGEIVPPTLLDPALRVTLDYSDNDFADNDMGLGTAEPSRETVTFVASSSGISNLGSGDGKDVLELQWFLSTDRVGWREADVAFRYETPDDIVEEQESLLKVYQAPSLAGPWRLVPNQNLDTDNNEISGRLTELGYFALTIAQDAVCPGDLAYFETFEGATTIDPAALGFTVEDLAGNGTIPALSTWLVANDLTLEPVFVGGFDSLNSTNYAIQFGDSVSTNDDWMISPTFDLDGSATYLVQFFHEAGQVGASDLNVYLETGDNSSEFSGQTPIIQLVDINATASIRQSLFKPLVSEAHRLAFHEVSSPPGSSFYTSIDNIAVVEFSLPDSLSPEITLSVTEPLTVEVGGGLTEIIGTANDVDHSTADLIFKSSGWPEGLTVNVRAAGTDGEIEAVIGAQSKLPTGIYSGWIRAIDPCGQIAEAAASVEAVSPDTCGTTDTDEDGVPDACDVCPGSDDSIDTDSDGVPDGCDLCEGSDDSIDTDGDGVPDGCDICSNSDDSIDTDSDGVPDGCDLCEGSDDSIDTDGDGVPDGCDICSNSDDSIDTDSDGVPDGCDLCEGSDDSIDADGDGVPDGCDICAGSDASGDSDTDGVCDDLDVCLGDDSSGDGDGDGLCADLDCDDGNAANDCVLVIFGDGFESGDTSAWGATVE